MINWAKGITARYYGAFVDPKTWLDTSTFEVTGGSVKYSDDGSYQSADLNCRGFSPNEELWVRIYLDARQNGDGELVPLFTGLTSVSDVSYNGRIDSETVQCYSVLAPADKVLLPLGWFLSSGSYGADAIKDLLTDVIPAPIVIEGESPYITSNIIAESNETNLSMVAKILKAINWRLKISGDGTVRLMPQASSPVAMFDSDNNDVVGLNVTIKRDWYGVPNVFRAVSGGTMSIARDEDPDSMFSIPNRGREIWMEETNCTMNDGEKIAEYAERRLREEQNIYRTISYSRRFDPNVDVSDLVIIKYPEINSTGIFQVTSQSLTLGYGGEVSEEVIGI